MIKDIGPPVDESDAGTGGSRRARNERQPVQKPWSKKEGNATNGNKTDTQK